MTEVDEKSPGGTENGQKLTVGLLAAGELTEVDERFSGHTES